MHVSDQAILAYIVTRPGARREDIRRHAAPGVSKTTIWRALKRFVDESKLQVAGKGRATGYSHSAISRPRHLQFFRWKAQRVTATSGSGGYNWQ